MRRFRRPRHATVVAYLALFFALGGSAMAAYVVSSNSQIGPNTIYGANKPSGAHDNIVDGSITATDIKASSIGNSRIIDGSLIGADLANATVTAAKIAPNAMRSSLVLDGSLTGADLANDTLTGTQIAESTLAKVPAASNADTVGGLAPSALIQGQGRIFSVATSVDFDGSGTVASLPGFVDVQAFCNSDGTLQYGFSTGASSVNVFVDKGGPTPAFLLIDANTSAGSSNWLVGAIGGVTISLEGGGKVATLFLYNHTFHNPFTHADSCALQGHAIVQGA